MKKMRKGKKISKKLGAMTLVEVLVALAVFTIMSSLLAGSVAMVCGIFRKTDHLTKKVFREAPIAENNDKTRSFPVTDADNNPEIKELEIKMNGGEGAVVTAVIPYAEYVVSDAETDIADFKFVGQPPSVTTVTTLSP